MLALACGILVVTGTLSTAAGPHPGDSAESTASGTCSTPSTSTFARPPPSGSASCSSWPGSCGTASAQACSVPAAVGLLVLLLVQMSVGELQWRNQLPWWLVLIHVGLAAAVWAWTVGARDGPLADRRVN